jgi:aryl-alcohol dehydrogenase-like predicted oxidoreductase
VNWIDTAAVYGFGHSEEVVARAIKGRAMRPYIFTKCSRLPGSDGKLTSSLKAASIKREVEDSLRRLEIDVIDLYQIHWPFPDEDLEEGWSTMAKLQDEGKVRYIGVSNFNVSQMSRLQAIAPISSLQPPYSLLKREVEESILPFCQEQNIGVIVYAPMGSGLLAGKLTAERIQQLPENDWRHGNTDFQEPRLARNLQLVELLRRIGQRHGRLPGEVAIAWTLHHPAVTAAIVGVRRPAQVDEIVGAGDFRLNEQELAEIDDFLRQNP